MLCISAAYVSCDVCPSVTFVHSVETNKHIFKFFSLLLSHTVLLFSMPNIMAVVWREPP